jgi:hypothetical protein
MSNHDKDKLHQPDEGPRLLTPAELDELRRDMAEASAWIRAELKRRRREKESSSS